MKKTTIAVLLSFLLIFGLNMPSYADVVEGDVILSLGQDLTDEERDQMLASFDATEDTPIIEVTNDDEYTYLGDYVPASKIGSKAISSAKVTYTAPDSGINVKISERIRYITPDMYKNALVTAGIEDANIFVDSPVNVSGTAALTGIMKAYEASAGEKLPEDVKKAANEELVVTSELGETVGEDKATDFINDIKVQVAENAPKSREEVRDIVINVTNKYNINLTPEQEEKVIDLFDNLRNLDIDWNEVGEKAKVLAGNAKEYLSSEEGQSFLMSLKAAFNRFIDWFAGLFQ